MKRWQPLAVLACLGALSSMAAAQRKRDAVGDFQRELEAVFVDDGLTAAEAAARARRASPAATRRRATAEVAAAEATRAKLALVPSLAGRANVTQLSEVPPAQLALGGQVIELSSLDRAYGAGAQLAVPLSDYLLRAPMQISAASAGARSASLEAAAANRNAELGAREAYYEWLRATLGVLVARRQLAQVEATLAQVKTLVEVQRASSADLLRVQSQRAQAQQTVARLTAGLALREEQLRLQIDADEGEELAPDAGERDELAMDAPPALALAKLVASAARRPELAAAAERREAKRAQRGAEVAALLPRISAVAAVDYANPNPRVFPPRDELELSWSAGLVATWSINDILLGVNARRRVAAEAAETAADLRSVEHKVRLEVLAARQAVELSRSAIDTSQQGLLAAEEGYRVRKDLFAAGRASVIEIIDAETELARARIAAIDARIDMRLALDKLAHASAIGL